MPALTDARWFESMFASSADAMFACEGDGRITRVNRAFEKLTGYTAKELLARRLQDITPADHLPVCVAALGGLARGKKSCTFQKEYARKDGGRVAVRVTGFRVSDAAGRRAGFAGVARDVSGFKKVQSELARMRDKTEKAREEALSLARAALESTADGLLIVDLKGRFRGFNRRFLEMWGIPRGTAAAREDAPALAFVIRQLKSPEAFLKRVRQIYANPEAESFDSIEFKDGRMFERYSRPQKLGPKVVGRVWSFRDVTQQRVLEKEIAQLHGREQARIGRELHDSLGQTLTAISLLAKTPPADAAAQLPRIHELAKTAMRQVRAVSRGLLPPDLEAGDLAAALGALADGARDLFGIRCVATARGDCRVADRGAAVELYRVAQEAVTNAAKHARARTVRVAMEGDARMLRLTVEDDGIGLPTKRPAGKGLGLAIMRHRARTLGGTFSLSRRPRGGTRVALSFPRPGPRAASCAKL